MKVRLMRGDCLERMQELPAGSVDMVLCDLPYGVTARNSWDSVIPFDALWECYFKVAKPNCPFVLTATQPFASALAMSKPEAFKYEWIWSKPQGTGFLNAKKQPLRSHEQVLIFYRSQPTYNPQMRTGFKPYTCKSGRASSNYGEQVSVTTISDGTRYPLTVLSMSSDKDQLHPTQKPVALMDYLIKTYTNEGDTVLDNCMGSGTTGVACVRTKRNFIGIEKDKNYFQIAKERIKKELSNESF